MKSTELKEFILKHELYQPFYNAPIKVDCDYHGWESYCRNFCPLTKHRKFEDETCVDIYTRIKDKMVKLEKMKIKQANKLTKIQSDNT